MKQDAPAANGKALLPSKPAVTKVLAEHTLIQANYCYILLPAGLTLTLAGAECAEKFQARKRLRFGPVLHAGALGVELELDPKAATQQAGAGELDKQGAGSHARLLHPGANSRDGQLWARLPRQAGQQRGDLRNQGPVQGAYCQESAGLCSGIISTAHLLPTYT